MVVGEEVVGARPHGPLKAHEGVVAAAKFQQGHAATQLRVEVVRVQGEQSVEALERLR